MRKRLTLQAIDMVQIMDSLIAWSLSKTYSDGRREIERLEQKNRIESCKRKLKSIDDQIESMQKIKPASLLAIYKLNRQHESIRGELYRLTLLAKRHDEFDMIIKNRDDKLCRDMRAQIERRMDNAFSELGMNA